MNDSQRSLHEDQDMIDQEDNPSPESEKASSNEESDSESGGSGSDGDESPGKILTISIYFGFFLKFNLCFIYNI